MSEPAQPSAAPSAQLACPECQQNITYYDVAGSEYYACPHCHVYFQWSGEETPKVLGKYDKQPEKPLIPLGTLGILHGRQWRVTGFVKCCETRAEQYFWTEYQLFQPETGEYTQLAQYRGHWTFIKPVKERIKYTKLSGRFVENPEGTYKLYNRY